MGWWADGYEDLLLTRKHSWWDWEPIKEQQVWRMYPCSWGLDYHRKSVQVCVVDAAGAVLVDRRCGNSVLEVAAAVGPGREVMAGGTDRGFCSRRRPTRVPRSAGKSQEGRPSPFAPRIARCTRPRTSVHQTDARGCELNMMTVEDPVEYDLSGAGLAISQTQVDPKKGLTFATGLRHILRQDPDVIMVGEVRDEETARIAVQASLTGRLVLSTLPTTHPAPSPAWLISGGWRGQPVFLHPPSATEGFIR